MTHKPKEALDLKDKEIYLSDPQLMAADKLKTILREPVRRPARQPAADYTTGGAAFRLFTPPGRPGNRY